MSKWICKKCMYPCYLELNDSAMPDSCIIFEAPAPWEPEPKPEKETDMEETYTLGKAIAKALEMGGGEIWLNNCVKWKVDPNGILRDSSESPYGRKLYTLGPPTFGWDEALERLQRGERVKVVENRHDDGKGFSVICPSLETDHIHDGHRQLRSISNLKDKRFTEAE